MLRFGFTALLFFAAVACGRGSNQQGRPANISIVASFPEAASEVDDAPPLNLALDFAPTAAIIEEAPTAAIIEEAPTAAIIEEAPTAPPGSGPAAKPTSNANTSYLDGLNETLNGAEKLFTHKRAFRWMSYRITNGSNVVKADSIPIVDPQLAELPPIEINAFIDDRLNVKMSFMQVDFQSEADAKDFCNNGSVGLIRAWSASAEPIVDDSGVVALEFSESGRSGVMMSVVGLSKKFDPGLMKTTLYNSFTDTKLNDDVCAVESVFPKFNSEQMFLKMMTFTHPFGDFALVHSGEKQRWSVVSNEVTWESLLANAREKDIGTDLGVASAFKADVVEGSLILKPALYGEILPNELIPAFTVDAGDNKIASGDGHTCAISDGRLSCWGNNSQGQVSGTSSGVKPILRPQEVNPDWEAHAVFAGPNHTCAIVDDKSAKAAAVAKCWGEGFSNSEHFFELANEATQTIATSANHTCAVPSTSKDESNVSCVSHQGSAGVVSTSTPISIPAKTDTSLFRIAISDDAACIFAPPSVEAAPVVTCYPLSSTAGLTSSVPNFHQ